MRLSVVLATAVLLLTPAAALAQDEEDRCEPRKQGEQCGEGKGRTTPGGGNTGNVSHKGWPKITGILWKVLDSGDHERTGTEDNDELLGHHGDDTVVGLDGKDVLWGDWELAGNGTKQSDVLRGGDGNDFLYPSHGKNLMYGGGGNDRIIAYYGTRPDRLRPGRQGLRPDALAVQRLQGPQLRAHPPLLRARHPSPTATARSPARARSPCSAVSAPRGPC